MDWSEDYWDLPGPSVKKPQIRLTNTKAYGMSPHEGSCQNWNFHNHCRRKDRNFSQIQITPSGLVILEGQSSTHYNDHWLSKVRPPQVTGAKGPQTAPRLCRLCQSRCGTKAHRCPCPFWSTNHSRPTRLRTSVSVSLICSVLSCPLLLEFRWHYFPLWSCQFLMTSPWHDHHSTCCWRWAITKYIPWRLKK